MRLGGSGNTLPGPIVKTLPGLHSNDPAVSAATGGEIVTYLVKLIAERRKYPRDDLISGLVIAQLEGCPLSDEECLDAAFLLFIAGLDTVTSQLGVVFHYLATHPRQQAELRASAEGRDIALEELLRLFPIVPPVRNLTWDYVLALPAATGGGSALAHRGQRVGLGPARPGVRGPMTRMLAWFANSLGESVVDRVLTLAAHQKAAVRFAHAFLLLSYRIPQNK